MSVSGTKEPGVLSRQSSSVSAGIPLKKRRFFLVQPPSPPRQAPPAENDVNKKEDSSSNIIKEESNTELKNKEESFPDLKAEEGYGSDLKDKERSHSEFKRKEVSASDNKGDSGTDFKNKECSSSQHPSEDTNVADSSLVMPDVSKNSPVEVKKEKDPDPSLNLVNPGVDVSRSEVPLPNPSVHIGSVSKLDSRTQLSLTEKSAIQELSGTAIGADMVGMKKDIANKLVDEDCKLKLSTCLAKNELSLGPKTERLATSLGIQDKEKNSIQLDMVDTSLLSLSLIKGNSNVREKSNDASSSCDTTDRSNWDLNTTMDDWEGSAGDGASEGTIDASSKKMSVDILKPSLGSPNSPSVCSSKGKQVMATAGQRPSFSTLSIQQNHQPEDTTLSLALSTFRGTSSVKVASGIDASNSSMQNTLMSAVNNSPRRGVVKAEPVDENSKNHAVGDTGDHMKLLLDCCSVKKEPIERNNPERLSTSSSQKSIEHKSIKLEQAVEGFQELNKTGNVILKHSVTKDVHCQESGSSSSSSVPPVPLTPLRSPLRLVTSSELSASMDISSQSVHSVHIKDDHKGKDAFFQDGAADVIYKPVQTDGEANVSKLDTCESETVNVDDPEMSGSKRTNENSHDLHANREGCVSDEEKVNIPAETMEYESYGSDSESDGNQAVNRVDTQGRCVKDDDDYEDGEVREPTLHSRVGGSIEIMDIENVKPEDNETKDSSACEIPVGGEADQIHPSKREGETEVQDDKTIECVKESIDETSNEYNEQLAEKNGNLQQLLPDIVAEKAADEKLLPNSSRRKPLDHSGKKSAFESNKKDISSDETTSSGHKTVTVIGESTNGNAKLVSMAGKPDSSLSIVESAFNGNEAAKDTTSIGNRSRIINLPRASVTSPGRMRSIADRPLPSRSGRDRYSDIEGEKFLHHRNRDEVETDGAQRFIREKFYDQPYRHSRPYGRGRGRFSGRLNSSRSEWDNEREFALEGYNSGYRFSRSKRSSAMTDAELDANEFAATSDGSALSAGRGRKPLDDDLPSFRHLSSRRLSPDGRDGPATRDIRMLRRIHRNISPSRRSDENGSELVGLEHDEKLGRPLPDQIIDPAYTRSQPIYDSGTGQFVRANRNFSTVQRRGFPRVRSKSPVGSRARSPGPWSPRRRSPDGFSGLSQLTQHRSADLYGMERIRSPERSCFPEEMVTRRRGSPFMARPSNDMRDVESGREHGHPRPMNTSRRSPSDRVFGRSNRRLDVSDSRIGTGEDEYFGRPVHSNRFHEFHGDGTSDERRKCTERRGLVRSFRPPYIGDGENLRFHLDEGPRPFRFCAEGETDFGGRSMREREFDGRIKNRPVIAPRRIRNIEEQEGNYRHNGQVWHDDGFNEAPGFKRRRF